MAWWGSPCNDGGHLPWGALWAHSCAYILRSSNPALSVAPGITLGQSAPVSPPSLGLHRHGFPLHIPLWLLNINCCRFHCWQRREGGTNRPLGSLAIDLLVRLPPTTISERKAFHLLSALLQEHQPRGRTPQVRAAVFCAESSKEPVRSQPWCWVYLLSASQSCFSSHAASSPQPSISIYQEALSSSNLSKVTHEWLTRIHSPELSCFLNPLLWAL